MSERQNEQPPAAAADASGLGGPDRSRRPGKKIRPEPPEPMISAFFSDAQPSVAAFSKALKIQKVTRFAESDSLHAMERMQTNDSDGARLWALISQSKAPEAVDRWMWNGAQHRLTQVLGDAFDPTEPSAERILGQLIATLGPACRSKEKATSRSAENWLRIGICWLVEKRSLHPWIVAERLTQLLFVDQKRALRLTARAITRGKSAEFKLAVATAASADNVVKSAKSERDAERRISVGLRRELNEALSRIDQLQTRLGSEEEDKKRALTELQAARALLEGERQHWGHDVSELEAAHRVLLSERVAPLVRDVIDALEIEPAAIDVARRRLRSVLDLIQGERA